MSNYSYSIPINELWERENRISNEAVYESDVCLEAELVDAYNSALPHYDKVNAAGNDLMPITVTGIRTKFDFPVPLIDVFVNSHIPGDKYNENE